MAHLISTPKWLSLVCLLLAHFLPPATAYSQVHWTTDLASGFDRARNNGLLTLVYFHSRKAQPCLDFEANTLLNTRVSEFLNSRFVPVALEVDQAKQLAERFGVYRVPTCIVLDSRGEEFARLLTQYSPEDFINALAGLKPLDRAATVNPTGDVSQNEIYRESFDTLFGWGNDGSNPGTTLQLSLVKGFRGRAFKVDYHLDPSQWNYVQFTMPLDPANAFEMSPPYTVIFKVAGKGGANKLDVKFVDGNGTNYGATLPIPTDFKAHQYVLTSDEIKYLWGGDKELTAVYNIQFAITPDKDKMDAGQPLQPDGSLYLDELIILPGKLTNIPRDNPIQTD